MKTCMIYSLSKKESLTHVQKQKLENEKFTKGTTDTFNFNKIWNFWRVKSKWLVKYEW